MTKREKLKQKISQNPKNVLFEDLRKLLEQYGFILDRVRGSHHSFVYEKETIKLGITIPYRKPLKVIYVKKALVLIEEIESSQEDTSDE